MAHARVTYTGNGSSTSYTVPFPFINRTHVVVTVNAVTQTLTTHYVWLNDSTIQFVTAPPSSQAVVFRRYTTITERLVDFHDAAVLTEADLDLNSLQGFVSTNYGPKCNRHSTYSIKWWSYSCC